MMDVRLLQAAEWYSFIWPVEGQVIFFDGLKIQESNFYKASLIIKQKRRLL